MRYTSIQSILTAAVLCTAATSFGAGAAAGGGGGGAAAAPAAPAPSAPAPASSGAAANGGTLIAPSQGPSAGSSLFGPVQGPTAGSSLFGPVQGPTAGSSLFGPQAGSPGSSGSSLFSGGSTTVNGSTVTTTNNGSAVISGSSSGSGTGTAVIVPGQFGMPSGVSASGDVIVGNPSGTGVSTGVVAPDVVVGGGGAASVPANGQPLSTGMGGTMTTPSGQTTPAMLGATGNSAPANVPPPAAFKPGDQTQVTTPAVGSRTTIEGQLVDLNTGSSTTPKANGSVIAERSTLASVAEAPSAGHSVEGADVQVIVAGFRPTPSGAGTIASVNPTPAGQSFGSQNRLGVTNSFTPATDSVVTTKTVRSPDGKLTITVGNTIDPAASKRELEKGTQAGVLVGNQMYMLSVDPKQLASYAGKQVRVSGRVSTAGSIVPDRFEVQSGSPGEFREVALSAPTDRPKVIEREIRETRIVTDRD